VAAVLLPSPAAGRRGGRKGEALSPMALVMAGQYLGKALFA